MRSPDLLFNSAHTYTKITKLLYTSENNPKLSTMLYTGHNRWLGVGQCAAPLYRKYDLNNIGTRLRWGRDDWRGWLAVLSSSSRSGRLQNGLQYIIFTFANWVNIPSITPPPSLLWPKGENLKKTEKWQGYWNVFKGGERPNGVARKVRQINKIHPFKPRVLVLIKWVVALKCIHRSEAIYRFLALIFTFVSHLLLQPSPSTFTSYFHLPPSRSTYTCYIQEFKSCKIRS